MGSKFKDFVKNCGKTVKDTAIDGLAQGIRANELSNRYSRYENTLLYNDEYAKNIEISNTESSNYLVGGSSIEHINPKPDSISALDILDTLKKFTSVTIYPEERATDRYTKVEDADQYKPTIPNWGYNDFINERNIFLKHLSNGYDIPNWLYFKLFFEFDTYHGLFGGILNLHLGDKATTSDKDNTASINCAYKYLEQCSKRYRAEKISDRASSLVWFTRLLSYININAPWFFKNVKNLSNVSNPIISNFNSEDRFIEIELNQDAIDMRITTLLSLYKYACYDDMNQKEIIPENLRKFNLCVVLFSSPINGVHNMPVNNTNNMKFKNFTYSNNEDTETSVMSYKLYKFMNCEIDFTTIGGYIPNDLTNDSPFQLGNNTLKIKYDRVYEYNANEFMGILIGSDGIYYENTNIKVEELSSDEIAERNANNFIHNKMASLLGNNTNFILGNIYGQDKALYKESTDKAIDRVNSGTKYFTDYTKAKFALIAQNRNSVLDIGYDKIYQLLGVSYKSGTALGIYNDGTVLNGHGKYGIGSDVWESKIRRSTEGGGLSVRDERLSAINNFENFSMKKYLHNKVMDIRV